MVYASTRTTAAELLDKTDHKPISSSTTKNSFSKQFGAALEGPLNRSAAGSRGGINTHVAPGQNSGARQILAGVTARSTAQMPSGVSTPDEEIPTMLGMGPVAGTAPVQYKGAAKTTLTVAGPVPGSAPSASSTTSKAQVPEVTTPPPASQSQDAPAMTEGDAYWAAQPAAVQVLRGMPDDEAKDKLALRLAGQGYQIDTQIMVWNWDPQMTMQVRENQGYAWVPSFGQSNIPVGPGVSDPFEPVSYNPGNPPPGSIRVSTAFAVGTIENPLVQIPASDT
jgi:hypothetical protein